LIEGSNVALTIADDPADEEIDITVAAAGGGGGGSNRVIVSNPALSVNRTGAGRTLKYGHPQETPQVTDSVVHRVVMPPCTLKTLRVVCTITGDPDASLAIIARKNGVDTALAVNFDQGTEMIGSYATDISFSANDLLSMKYDLVTFSSSATATFSFVIDYV
jgi:hypothetical protein